MRLYPEEPAVGLWEPRLVAEVVAGAIGVWPSGRPAVIAVDGRSSSGKTTLAATICEAAERAVAVHTDDVAWHHSVSGWDDLLKLGVLEPARTGEAVSYRPPAWDARRRPGAIHVPAGTELLVVEGVGAGRRELASCVDGTIWVQSDLNETLARDRERVAAGEISLSAYDDWMQQERPFQADQKTWIRAQQIVCGSPAEELPSGYVLADVRASSSVAVTATAPK